MTLDYSKHKNILLQILKDIYSDAAIAPHLGFKGGTAALMFYGLSRDSVDLDFDLLDESKKEIVFEKIQKIVAGYGKMVDSRIKRFNLMNIISYDATSQNIKVEVNRRDFGSTPLEKGRNKSTAPLVERSLTGSKYDLKTLLGISMLVIVREDMFAHKLMAMHERVGKTSRDIYDVWFFLKNNWPINKEIVEKRSGTTFKELLKKTAEQMEKFDNRNILVGLGDFLTESQKDWARAKLLTETIFLLKARLESEK